jgi:hypothetical protein
MAGLKLEHPAIIGGGAAPPFHLLMEHSPYEKRPCVLSVYRHRTIHRLFRLIEAVGFHQSQSEIELR